MSPGPAPSAMRSPISRVRRPTPYWITPNRPAAVSRRPIVPNPVATLTASRVHQGKVRKLRIFEPTVYYSIDYIDQEVVIFPLDRRQTDIKTLRIQKEEPLKKELRNFLDCIRAGKTTKVTGEEGLRALRLAHDVLKEAGA
jgi:predicted dehydrogenase